MAISKSTPYVRYKKDFTSSLHLGTIHIESEYLDRTQKTTIESIHGMTWHNKVVNENKELNLLSDTQLELTELEKQYWNTGEKRVSVDEIHTLEEVEPNEDGTYTYTVNSMEGEYIEIYDGINNITSTSDGLDGQFEIVYDTTEEDINGNIALDSIVPQYEITDSGVGTVTGAKSTGLTLVNHITEPSKDEVVAIEQQEGQYFTIENTVQGNIKSAILKGQTLVNILQDMNYVWNNLTKKDSFSYNNGDLIILNNGFLDGRYWNLVPKIPNIKSNTEYTMIFTKGSSPYVEFGTVDENGQTSALKRFTNAQKVKITSPNNGDLRVKFCIENPTSDKSAINLGKVMFIEGDYTNIDIPYFEGMKSVQMPVLTTTGKNLFDVNGEKELSCFYSARNNGDRREHNDVDTYTIKIKPNTEYFLTCEGIPSMSHITYWDENLSYIGAEPTYGDNTIRQITSPQGAKYMRLPIHKEGVLNIQIEEGSVATPYEPFKSNILTVNEEVTLRKIGDVQDELDLETGELTQRIGEIVLDGSEEWIPHDYAGIQIFKTKVIGIRDGMKELMCNRINNSNALNNDTFHFKATLDGFEIMLDDSSITTIDNFKQYISLSKENPIIIQYQLATESIKTVDLTVQNQDGNTIPHIQTQPTTTHVSTSSDGLSPVVEMSCSYDTIIKPNTTYTIKLDRPIVSDAMYLQVDLGGTMMMLDADVNAFTIKTPSTLSHSQLRLSGTGNTVKEIIVLEGNRVNDKIEYFEGMKNVENPILVVSNCQYVFGKGGRK